MTGRKTCGQCLLTKPLEAFAKLTSTRCTDCCREHSRRCYRQWTKPGDPLTQRQSQVADLMCLGLLNGEIAGRLGIAPGVVKKHVRKIIKHLGADGHHEGVRVRAAVLYTEKKLKEQV